MSIGSLASAPGLMDNDDDELLPHFLPPRPPTRVTMSLRERGVAEQDTNIIAQNLGALLAPEDAEEYNDDSSSANSAATGSISVETYTDSGSNASDSDTSSLDDVAPDTWMCDQFKQYCDEQQQNQALSDTEITAVRLLHLLKEKKAPLNAYKALMDWHLKQSNQMHSGMRLHDNPSYIGRGPLLKKLAKRYNYSEQYPFQKAVKLPVSGTVVRVTLHDTKAAIQRLLTDPRIKPADYLFWEPGNPLAKPPDSLDYVEDLITGRAYLDTYKDLITKEGQALLGVVPYCDGTPVSHFHDMEIIQVKISLGIHTRKARLKSHCWAVLGYIEKIHEQGGRGRTILQNANHLDTQDGAESVDSEESLFEMGGVGDKNDQDFHAMMAVILGGFVDIQRQGFLWDHHDPVKGVTHKDVHYKIFVPFIRSDTKEADLLCAKYGQRFSSQQICRKCHIPLQEADDHTAKYPLKTVTEIKALVQKADLKGLQALSQTYLTNAFYKIRFSTGNDQGIHGSCPSELLHAFLLGTFKYLRDIFFEYIGKDSEGAKLINALAKIYGKLFSRQSDRTLPGTAFSRGIQAGKLMAKDYRGVLLVMLAVLRSTKGQSILQKNRNFKESSARDDWILLVELMLEWESFLNLPRMYKSHVKRLGKKHRFIMYIMRKVAQRHKGMGLKLMKFHAILHIQEDIIQFGVPLETDTSANESHHKKPKLAATQTQMAAETFNVQTATRLTEYDLLDLGMEEINSNGAAWKYFWNFPPGYEDSVEEDEDPVSHEIITGGTNLFVYEDEDGDPCFKVGGRSKHKAKTQWNVALIEFLLALQNKLHAFGRTDSLAILTEHRRNGMVFRGHPNYRGKGGWRDWVWVDWGHDGALPAHIWCFVRLEGMPRGKNAIMHGGILLKDGVFAVVETVTLEENEDEIARSDLMVPVLKDVALDVDGNAGERLFFLADTEAFADVCCTIPDIGGPPNRYFVVKPKNKWADLFIIWLNDPHNLDVMDDLKPVKEDLEAMDVLEAEPLEDK